MWHFVAGQVVPDISKDVGANILNGQTVNAWLLNP